MRRALRYLIFFGFGLLIVMNFLIKENYYFKVSDKKKTILLWTEFFGDKNWQLGNDTLGEKFFEEIGCVETRCVITSDKTLMKVEEFDALVFHAAQSWEEIPESRKSHQIYVVASLESPVYTSKDLETKADLFNWTMTYRLGSYVQWFYGGFINIESDTAVKPVENSLTTIWRPAEYFRDEKFLESIKNKTKDMAWLVSHCETQSNRGKLVKELQKYLTVDVYGDCGNLSCAKNNDSCTKMLSQDYYFYTSFENSLCQDYVTEKFYQAFQLDLIPVAYGSANYSLFAPQKSFIDVAQFKTVEELANYLNFLKENPEEYAKFFWWRKFYKVDERKFQFVCNLCEKLHENHHVSKRGDSDINSFWYNGTCHSKPKIKFD